MTSIRIDALQYCNFSEEIFRQLRAGGVDAIHVTVAYHEDFAALIDNLARWNRWFELYPSLIRRAVSVADIEAAKAAGQTAVLFGLQNPGPIGADLSRIEILHQLGVRFMQLTYNLQSLLGAGCFETEDAGLTRFGHQAVAEMNRVGMVVDLSHAGGRTSQEAIEASGRPVAITHANPAWWHEAPRNISDDLLKTLTARGGMLGFSLYPHHLAGGPACTLESFTSMIAEAASRYGAGNLGFGSDLCQDQPDSVVAWMREGHWMKPDPAAPPAVFPDMPSWFKDNRDWGQIEEGLVAKGFSEAEVAGIMGGNWLRFFGESFAPEAPA